MRIKQFDLVGETRALMQRRGITFDEARRELGRRGLESRIRAMEQRSKSFQRRIEREERQGLR